MPRHPARSGRASTASKTHSKPYDKHRKFRRKRVYDLFTPPEIPPKKDFLQRLPVELLAGILKFSSSVTVLAVARTCKWLCETLTHEDQEFIWKAARRNYYVENLPDPPPGLPEPAYASAIFDDGNCLNCRCPCPEPPSIFHFKNRICSKNECRRSLTRHFTSTLVIPDEADKQILGNLLPRALFRWQMEFVDVFEGVGITVSMPGYRIKDIREILRLWKASEGDPQERDRVIERLIARGIRNQQYYKHEKQYARWFQVWRYVATGFIKQRTDFINAEATASGWALEDLRNAPAFKSLMDACNRERDVLTDTWWRASEREIAKEVATLAEVRTRRSEERARIKRQRNVEQLWRALTQSRPDQGHYSVPPLNIFLSLPLIRNATKTNITDVGPRLDESHAFLSLLDTEISGWARNTQKTLAATLGYKRTGGKSKTAAEHHKDLQEFLDRATSLFECSKCRRTRPIEHEQWTTMSHREVIQHRCPKGTTVTHVDPSTGEERTKENRDWNVHNFVPDKVAIAAVRLALSVADPPFDESTSIWTVGSDDRLEEFPRYVCLTCPSRITMSIWEIPGHAKRHKSLFEASQKRTSGGEGGMSFELGWVVTELCTKEGTSIRSNLYEHMEQLMSNTPGGRRKRALREYACRHCELPSATAYRAPRLFTIDGLQSHLKSSHGIYPLRNEDFCHVRKLSLDNLERFSESEESPKDFGQPRSDVAAFGGIRMHSSDDPELPTLEQLAVDEDDN